ncbi:sulfate ABC transporter substrate-binding protein [Xanthobacter dioxanivorans]|uniref:Sulfate ABC transporter substrate-binding protein n=1 Tax=Xanthobacter dioxanivorans TaxID=2528964 RepID=A0A974PPP2_9HYPH|nr:sulfate ABC transporter substrate-binding protein [Xanthobacter dioxanivorans]QRG07472.1 sulfate ABC transporter substrate-binding protein [Xanthobacter dioxanivorans]
MITRRAVLAPALALALAGAAAPFSGAFAQQGPNTLLNVSYDISRELFTAVNAEFIPFWKQKTGQELAVNQSHAGSSRQARAILEGLEADVVTFNQVLDVDVLAKAGFVAKDWQKKFPNAASPYYSFPAFLVRAGNPKNIKDWSDLVRSDVKVIFPNPKTSGNARYTYLAAYAFALEQNKGDSAKADAFVKALLANVPVFDTGGRAATTTFVERETGDVLVTFEAETRTIEGLYPDRKLQTVVPSVSLLAEFPVAVVDKVVDKRGSRASATAYLEFLYSPAGQTIAAKAFHRVVDPKVAEQFKAQFPPVRLVKVEDVFGGWEKLQAEHFASGAKLDTLFGAR